MTAILALLWAAAGFFSQEGGGEPSGAGVAEISASTNRVLRQVELGAPNDVETGIGSTWVTNTDGPSATVTEIPAGPTGRPKPIELARATAISQDDLAVGEGGVWATVADALYRVDPANPDSAQRVADLESDGLLSGIDVGDGAVWITDSTGRTLSRVDPVSRRVTSSIALPGPGDGVAVGEGAVWVPSVEGGSLFKVSPRLGRVEQAISVAGAGNGVAAGAGSIWVTAARRDAVARIDPVSNQLSWIPVGDSPTDVSVSGEVVWVVNSGAGSVSRIDARSGKVIATVAVPPRPNRIAVDGDSVWVTFLGGAPETESPS